MEKKPYKPTMAIITFLITLVVFFLFLTKPAILELLELKAYDLRFSSRNVQPDIVLAVIDEKSLDILGRWPWPRRVVADLVQALSKQGARVIGFDIGFLEAENNPFQDLMTSLSQQIQHLGIQDGELNRLITNAQQKTDCDGALAKAICASSADVVLGYFFHMPENCSSVSVKDSEYRTPAGAPQLFKYPLHRHDRGDTGGSDPLDMPLLTAAAPEAPPALLSRSTPFLGYFNMTPDRDGVIRWLPLVIQYQNDLYPPLAAVSAWLYLGRPMLAVEMDDYGIKTIHMGDRRIPTDECGSLLVNYPAPFGQFPNYSIADILKKEIPGNPFQDKLVLVGATAKGIGDVTTTPFGPEQPGLEIHAAALDNILTGNFLTQSKWGLVYDAAAILIIGLTLGIFLPRLNAIPGIVLASSLFLLQIALTQWVFNELHMRINVVYPLLTIILTYIALTVHRYFSETLERKKIKRIFRHYASPELVEAMVKKPEELKLGGKISSISVLFCDLANFTDISENRPPHEIVTIMSQYFNEMTETIFEFKGTLKEYVGDELMALFGAPLYYKTHALNACRAALAIQDHLHRERVKAREKGGLLLRARVGINSGDMLIGNLGSKYRFSYGALGDNVNLGSRLEGLNKIYGTSIILGGNTETLVRGHFWLRKLDYVRVKGKKNPVRVFELLGHRDVKLPEHRAAALDLYQKGHRHYLEKDWDAAVAAFQATHDTWPDDKASLVMIKRCEMYRRIPPPEDWDGVFMERRK